jgi:hypothetical protein
MYFVVEVSDTHRSSAEIFDSGMALPRERAVANCKTLVEVSRSA